jgi:hypothetical protein
MNVHFYIDILINNRGAIPQNFPNLQEKYAYIFIWTFEFETIVPNIDYIFIDINYMIQ